MSFQTASVFINRIEDAVTCRTEEAIIPCCLEWLCASRRASLLKKNNKNGHARDWQLRVDSLHASRHAGGGWGAVCGCVRGCVRAGPWHIGEGPDSISHC